MPPADTARAPRKWLGRYRWILLLIAGVLVGQLLLGFLLPKLQSNGEADARQDDDPTNDSSHKSAQQSATNRPLAPSSSSSSSPAQSQFTLRAGEVRLPAGCQITGREAVSAIHRAPGAVCKQHIADVTCAIQAGEFYARSLPNTCPNGSFIANRALGCYRDQKSARLLGGYYTNFKQLNSPGKCIQLCLQSGYLFAGVQYGSECFCGNADPPAEARLGGGEAEECGYACVGEPEQMCGGYFAMNVYETGISKFVPQVAELQPNGSALAAASSADVSAPPPPPAIRIVFLLTLNGRAVRQVHRLLKALYHPHHFYYIHVDARQTYLYDQLLPLEAAAPNIRLARRRFSTIWGGASLLTMLLAAMADLQTIQPDWPWDFVINLSESDFPVKSVDRLAEFLGANRDRNFVKSHGREVQRFIQKQGLDKTFVECDTHMWRTGDRQLPSGIQIDGGSDWVALSRAFVRFVTAPEAAEDELVAGLLRIFRHTLLPAESFFHTALRNSRFCNTYVDNNLHVTNWKRKLGCRCQYKHVVDWCGCSPNDFRPDDWQRLQATEAKQVFFARKFEPVVSQSVVLKLETWLFGGQQRRRSDDRNVRSYWQNVWQWRREGPTEEPALHAVAESILRLQFASELRQIHHVSEVNIFMENDQHRGFLVRAGVALANGSKVADVEVWARHDQLPQASRSLAVGKRIVHLEVASDYDQKEQMARNFVRVLGTGAEPVLVMHFSDPVATEAKPPPTVAAASFNCTCLWLSPAGVLEAASDMHVEENATPGSAGHSVHFSKPVLRSPLVAGVWTVRVVHGRNLVGKCDFFVVPDGGASAQLQDSELGNRTMEKSDAWQAFLPAGEERERQMQQALQDLRTQGAERTAWLDAMVRRFVVLRDVCFVAAVAGSRTLCAETSWSSLAPDPKSDIYADLVAVAKEAQVATT